MRSHRVLTLASLLAIGLTPALVFGATPHPARAATSTGAERRHDGVVRSVDPARNRLVIEELGAGGKARMLHVRVGGNARVVRSIRNPHPMDVEHEFTDTPITLGAVRPGDFVVLDMTSGKTPRADAVIVTLEQAR